MSKNYRSITVGFLDDVSELDVRREIDNFLLALHSYPNRFADDPSLSFEQHLSYIMAVESVKSGPQRVN